MHLEKNNKISMWSLLEEKTKSYYLRYMLYLWLKILPKDVESKRRPKCQISLVILLADKNMEWISVNFEVNFQFRSLKSDFGFIDWCLNVTGLIFRRLSISHTEAMETIPMVQTLKTGFRCQSLENLNFWF